MAQQQLLLLTLGTIIVGVGIYMGVLMFSSSSASSNKEQIIADLQELGADAYGFIYRPVMMGGGGGSYAHFALSNQGPWGPANANAIYSIASQDAAQIKFLAQSKVVEGATVTVTVDNSGKVIDGPTSVGF